MRGEGGKDHRGKFHKIMRYIHRVKLALSTRTKKGIDCDIILWYLSTFFFQLLETHSHLLFN